MPRRNCIPHLICSAIHCSPGELTYAWGVLTRAASTLIERPMKRVSIYLNNDH